MSSMRAKASVEAHREADKSPARVEQGAYGEYLLADRSFSKGEQVFQLDGKIATAPSKHSIQLDADRHIVTENAIWRFTNHACVPTMRIDTDRPAMIAVRDIAEGEELTFNYNTSEWDIRSPFVCGCGSSSCFGEVRGFKFLPEARRESIKQYLTPFLANKWRSAAGGAGLAEKSVRSLRPVVHVLVPYEREHGVLLSPDYDTPKYRAELDGWLKQIGLEWVWRKVAFDNLDEIIADLKALHAEKAIAIFNLCDGTELDGYPGERVSKALEAADLPFSGASAEFYRKTTSKLLAKRMLEASGVATPAYCRVVDAEGDVDRAVASIGVPLIVKPDVSAGSYGIDIDSVCDSRDAIAEKIRALQTDPYTRQCDTFVEKFISGREFTVFAVEDEVAPLGLRILTPCERVFHKNLPEAERFCSYQRHWDMPEAHRAIPEGEKYCVHAPVDGPLREQLADIVRRAVRAVSGVSYARCDVRQDQATGQLYVLEVNAQCDLSSDPNSEIGSILQFSGMNMAQLVEMLLDHALRR